MVGEPIESFIESVAGSGASRLDVPSSIPHGVKPELIRDFGGIHCVWQILFVGEDEENGISEFVLVQHTIQLLASLTNSLPIVAIDHEDQSLGVGEVVSPERSDLVLTTDVPDSE